jgi:acyl transferase domain-containing protein
MTDIEIVKEHLTKMEALLAHLTTVIETRKTLVDGFDDRLARMEKLQRSLGTTAFQLAAARVMTHWISGAISGALAGGVAAAVILSVWR